MQLLFVGDTKNRVYINNKQSLQEFKDNIQIEVDTVSAVRYYYRPATQGLAVGHGDPHGHQQAFCIRKYWLCYPCVLVAQDPVTWLFNYTVYTAILYKLSKFAI